MAIRATRLNSFVLISLCVVCAGACEKEKAPSMQSGTTAAETTTSPKLAERSALQKAKKRPYGSLGSAADKDDGAAALYTTRGGGKGIVPGKPTAQPSAAFEDAEKKGAGVSGFAAGAPAVPQGISKNAYYDSGYLKGGGQLDRMQDLVQKGILVDGKQIKLGAFPRRYAQGFAIPTDKALALNSDLDQNVIPTSGQKVHLQLGLQAIKTEAPKRSPLNVVLVIDRSGSMEDEGKMDAVQAAARRFVDGMKSQDVLGIVAYDSEAEVIVPAMHLRDKKKVLRAIKELMPGGSTNIHDGLKRGLAELKRNKTADTINSVILLSDGIVTAGISDNRQIAALSKKAFLDDMQTVTVGMGTEFNDSLMMRIAKAGGGKYHFIKDAEGIERFFKDELSRLTHVVARAVKVRVVLPDDVKLLRVLGSAKLDKQEVAATRTLEKTIDAKTMQQFGIQSDRKKDEAGIKFFIPNFFMGDSHVIMLELYVPPATGSRQVATVHLKCKDIVTRKNVSQTAAVTISFTTDNEQALASIKRKVKKNLIGFKTGEALLTAAEYLKRRDRARAIQAVDEQMTLLSVAAKRWADSDLEQDAALLSQYRDVLAALSPQVMQSNLGQYLTRSLTYSGYRITR